MRHVHSKKVIHRDLKGANVFVNQDGTDSVCLIGDFGVGKVM